nr:AAA family ATPase [uncultured Desulfuromonas sp.]
MIKSISLKNFRCFNDYKISLKKKNCIIGKNGSGKTCIVESFYLFSNFRTLKSRTKNHDLIKFGKSISEINVVGKNNLNLTISKNKKIYLDGFETDVLSFVKSIKCIFFLSDEIFTFFNKPSTRRKYFDQLIFNLNPNYLFLVQKYFKVLKNRNIDYRNNNNKEIDIWTDYLKEINDQIYSLKSDYISELVKCYRNIICSIYNCSYDVEIDIDRKKYYKGIESKEVKIGRTLFGHHLEDYKIKIDGMDINTYSSNGQKKIFLLILKLSHLQVSKKYFSEQTFIIDDLTSELDCSAVSKIINYLYVINDQIIITNIKDVLIDREKFNIINIDNHN